MRREKQLSELALKQEVTAISHLKAFLQARNEEDERTRLEIGEIERAIEKCAEFITLTSTKPFLYFGDGLDLRVHLLPQQKKINQKEQHLALVFSRFLFLR